MNNSLISFCVIVGSGTGSKIHVYIYGKYQSAYGPSHCWICWEIFYLGVFDHGFRLLVPDGPV